MPYGEDDIIKAIREHEPLSNPRYEMRNGKVEIVTNTANQIAAIQIIDFLLLLVLCMCNVMLVVRGVKYGKRGPEKRRNIRYGE